MSDLIDERNKREKMKNSIVKYWNVNYVGIKKNNNINNT